VWYRDPNAQGKKSSLTGGLSFGVCP